MKGTREKNFLVTSMPKL